MARVIQVIETEITRGKGSQEAPYYIAIQYWTLDGTLLVETPNPTRPTDGRADE